MMMMMIDNKYQANSSFSTVVLILPIKERNENQYIIYTFIASINSRKKSNKKNIQTNKQTNVDLNSSRPFSYFFFPKTTHQTTILFQEKKTDKFLSVHIFLLLWLLLLLSQKKELTIMFHN